MYSTLKDKSGDKKGQETGFNAAILPHFPLFSSRLKVVIKLGHRSTPPVQFKLAPALSRLNSLILRPYAIVAEENFCFSAQRDDDRITLEGRGAGEERGLLSEYV